MIRKFFFVLILGFIFTFSACDKTIASGTQSQAIIRLYTVPRVNPLNQERIKQQALAPVWAAQNKSRKFGNTSVVPS